MRWLVTGARGQLGSDLVAALAGVGSHDEDAAGPVDGGGAGGADIVRALGSAELDITDPVAVDAAIADFAPDVVLNAAGYTAVDAAETDELTAHRVNAVGPAHLAVSLARHGGRLIHVSTDYVFSGHVVSGDGLHGVAAEAPYPVDAPTGPRSAYGRTKLAGEQAVRELLPATGSVVRTAWVYGATGANFVKTMVRLEGERNTVDVVADQRGSPTWSADLARGLLALGRSDAPAGVYHCTNSGDTTWFGFTRAIFEELGADPGRVRATDSGAFVRPAPRPAYSVLSDEAWIGAGLPPMRGWREALHAAFDTVGSALRDR